VRKNEENTFEKQNKYKYEKQKQNNLEMSLLCHCSLNPCHTRTAFSRRPVKLQNAEVSAVRSQTSSQHRRSIVVASHRTSTGGAHFEHVQNKRRQSAF
jgi:hypothetical protein